LTFDVSGTTEMCTRFFAELWADMGDTPCSESAGWLTCEGRGVMVRYGNFPFNPFVAGVKMPSTLGCNPLRIEQRETFYPQKWG
jgi:hypothetical protein